MNFTTGLKVRLKAVSGHDLPQREVGVQHNVQAKMSKLKMTKGCTDCCCHLHCGLTEHGKSVGTLDIDTEMSKQYKFPDLLDRAWDECENYKVGLFDDMPVVQDKLVSLLRAINTDLGQIEFEEEEDQFSYSASANTSDTMSST